MFAGYVMRDEKDPVARRQINLQHVESNVLELLELYSFDREDKL